MKCLKKYLENAGESLSGQLVVNDSEEFSEWLQEGGGPNALPQQVLDGGQKVNLCLLGQIHQKPFSKKERKNSTQVTEEPLSLFK